MQPEPNAAYILHLFSAMVIAAVGGGVCLWALLTSPIRWDRFWIGLALLLLVAPIAFMVTSVRMVLSEETPEPGAVGVDTTYEVDTVSVVDAAGGVDTVAYDPIEAR
jgi:hypothetical protein